MGHLDCPRCGKVFAVMVDGAEDFHGEIHIHRECSDCTAALTVTISEDLGKIGAWAEDRRDEPELLTPDT